MLHKDFSPAQWQARDVYFQLGNVGAEVLRALNWRKSGRRELAFSALARALELLDLTVSAHIAEPEAAELLRSREIVCDRVLGANVYAVSDAQIERYFLQFATAARRQVS